MVKLSPALRELKPRDYIGEPFLFCCIGGASLIGAGALTLPYTLKISGWGLGSCLLVLSVLWSVYQPGLAAGLAAAARARWPAARGRW